MKKYFLFGIIALSILFSGCDKVQCGDGVCQAREDRRVTCPQDCEAEVFEDPDECICTAGLAPVCGNDGKTYSNSCRAECRGISIIHPGTCEEAIMEPVQTKPAPEVPSEYKDLYEQLDNDLDVFIDEVGTSPKYPTKFGASLLAANSNSGYTLIKKSYMSAVKTNLDALDRLGVKNVQMDIQFPILASGFHKDEKERQDFIDFYKEVAEDIKSRGMTLSVESQAIFTNPAYSTLPVTPYYKSLSFEDYKQGRLETLRTILIELDPDYLTVANEPNTEADLTGKKDLRHVDEYLDMVGFFVDNLQDVKGDTLIGAGLGTWEKGFMEFAKGYAQEENIDFINVHIYPINNGLMQDALKIGDIAKENHKKLVLGELGLYKIRDNEYKEFSGEEGSTVIYARDAYEFFGPLDQKFLEAVKLFAYAYDIEYTSVFWSRLFFAYLPYEGHENPGPSLMKKQNKAAFQAMLDGELSSTGEFYKELISG